MKKVYPDAKSALDGILRDGMMIMSGGFGLCGIAEWLSDAIRDAATFLGLGPRSRVLDIGSGIGGPARFLAHTTGCHVVALELQPELHQIGVDLTRRSGMESRVTHVCGDALTAPFMPSSFDAVVSFLAVLHVPDRKALMRRFFAALKPGGRAANIKELRSGPKA